VVWRDSAFPEHFERQPTPRIGCVKYLNARPLIYGWPGEVLLDHPAALCARIARGDLDVALVSSFEFLRNPIYRIVDDISISSAGPVYSVVLAHGGEISEIEQIDLDPAAETSVNLLRCLLAESRLNPRFTRTSTSLISAARARLLIGDQAIRFRRDHPELQFWDLGEAWKRIVDLPFVFALWLIRPELSDAREVADRLRALRDANLAKIDNLIAEEKDFDHTFCARYYGEHLGFNFGEKEKEGLRTFHTLCGKHGILPKEPQSATAATRREIKFNLV
jgi:chorismate dehydratase